MICSPHLMFLGAKIEMNEMGREHSTYAEEVFTAFGAET